MGIYKKGNTYWMIKQYKGRRVEESLGTGIKRLAEKRYAEILPRILDGTYFCRHDDPLMSEVIDRYMSEVSPTQKSHERNQEIATKFKDFFGNTLMSEVTVSLLSSYKAKRLSGEIIYGRGKGRKAGESTLKKELSFLRHVFNKAIDEWELCEINPVKKVIRGLKDMRRVRYVLSAEAVKLSDALSQSKMTCLKDMVVIACSTGLREGKIVNLTVSQCDFHHDRINIAGDAMKNEEPFSIRMTAEVKATLQRVIKGRKLISPYIFLNEQGKPYTGEAVSMAFWRACKRAAIHDLRFHDLRHDFATVLVNNGASLYQVQHALGHKDQRMSARYAHLLPENQNIVEFVDGDATTTTILRQSGKNERGCIPATP
jgi:integrase